jgi:Kef-type K+ transport system membrane component KefB
VRCGGALAVRLGEPRIAGEMVGAILVGPTILGGRIEDVVDGAKSAGIVGDLFPPLAVDVLTSVGALGMILYMLLVGLTIDAQPMSRAGTILALALPVIASTGLIALFAASWLEHDGGWKGPLATNVTFMLALAAALAAHGVPIAARILEERGLLRSEAGAAVIASGACVTTLALIVSGVAIRGSDRAAAAELAVIVAGVVLLVAIVAPLARSRRMRLSPRIAVAVLLAIALGAGAGGKAVIGSVLIGPLIVGIAVRNAGHAAIFLEARLGAIVRGALLPAFLAVAALHVNLRELGLGAIGPVAALIATVVVAKWVATYLSARVVGFDRPQSRATAGLLQCGGIMTVAISLDVLHAGIITTRTHALLTLAGLVTTLVAGPLLAASGLAQGAGDAPADDVAAAAATLAS